MSLSPIEFDSQQLGDVISVEESFGDSPIRIRIEKHKDTLAIAGLLSVDRPRILGARVIGIGRPGNDDVPAQEGIAGVDGLSPSAAITRRTQVVPHVICCHGVAVLG